MKILAAVDRSGISPSVVALTTKIAGGVGAQVLLLHIAPREADVFGRQVKRKVITDPVPEELQDRRDMLDQHAQTLAESHIQCDTLLIRGDPGPTLLREAERWGADLIIMGSHGRGAIYRKLMGSVSEAVIRDRRFPVLVLPASEEQSQ
jgi:nucleotide-binding universal stress UspA family protein